ncbi:unnamed protein product [Peronospora belbahrii]|nr:unnamed protein product [Peronospora belbahrii]
MDCLNVVIPRQNCAISPYGECVNSYVASNIGGYPMDTFTYCSPDDTMCSACRANWTNGYMDGQHVSQTAMCVGDSGCICLSACEMPNRDDIILNSWCKPVLDGSNFQLAAGLIAGTIALFVIAPILTQRQLVRHQRQDVGSREARRAVRAALHELRRPAAMAHLPRLNLLGWVGMREKLISSEQNRLPGNSGPMRPVLARLSTTPSAADAEQGDQYLIMSPSENQTHREL